MPELGLNPQLAEQRCVHEEKSCGKPLVAFQVNFIFQSRHSLTMLDSAAPPFTSVCTQPVNQTARMFCALRVSHWATPDNSYA